MPPFGPIWVPWIPSGDPWVSSYGAVVNIGPNVEVLQQTGVSVERVTSQLDSSALGLLAGVATGASELIVGDDVVPVRQFGSQAVPMLVLTTGTTNVLGGLTLQGSQIVSVVSTRTTALPDPPSLRSYDAQDGRLYVLQVDAAGATLGQLDTRLALLGTRSFSTVNVTGAVPAHALAMTWNVIEQRLFVADEVDDHAKHALRLLRLDGSGAATELWRTEATHDFPSDVLLSTSQEDEQILSITSHDHSEAVTLRPADGAPIGSRATQGRLLMRAIANRGDVVFPLKQEATDDRTNLRVELVHRADLQPGLCGTRWLRHHVDASAQTPLGHPQIGCPELHEHEQGDGDAHEAHD